MSFSPGTRIGPYEIISPLGAGGMGEVYRARDSRLARDVAIKVLPEAFAADPERLARFEREAQLLASLNHPNIAIVHGLEDITSTAAGSRRPERALVMELVEGETLADRIARGPLPVDEAVPLARQIADALEAAHEQGIIHRDLKPTNIKLTPDGKVKVLDFGLAKLAEPAAAAAATPLSMSPTVGVQATMQGALLGTAAYMSPEQARGKSVDRRTDIWAFGCVLYEMVTGQAAYGGSDIAETIAAILKTDPNWERLPPIVRPLVCRCLQKDPRSRLRDIGDARVYFEDFSTVSPADRSVGNPRRYRIVAAAAAAVACIALASAWRPWVAGNADTAIPSVRFAVPSSPVQPLMVSTTGTGPNIAIAADGSRIAYRVRGVAGNEVLLRTLDDLSPRSAGVNGSIFFSPDGRWLGVMQDGGLSKVPIDGGVPTSVCPVPGAGTGASWAEDGTIVFATNDRSSGLLRVDDTGGTPEILTTPDPQKGEVDHAFPVHVPNSSAVLFTVLTSGTPAGARVEVLDLETRARKVLLQRGTAARYVAPGYLVYANDSRLHAIGFNVDSLEVRGESVAVVDDVTSYFGGAEFAISRTGSLVYVPVGSASEYVSSLAWVDRTGREEAIPAPIRAYGPIRISPDGRRFVTDIREEQSDVWTWDFDRETLTRVTFDSEPDDNPIWTPDGQHIVFRSTRTSGIEVYRVRADGTGKSVRLAAGARGSNMIPKAVGGADNLIVLQTGGASIGAASNELSTVALAGGAITPLMRTPAGQPDISPDGRWIAYQSSESGQFEVYVRPFPDANSGRWQISTAGGTRPVWSRDGRELFYTSLDGTMMGVGVQTLAPFSAGRPTVVFRNRFDPGNGFRAYDVGPDGRFLMVKNGSETGTPGGLIVVVNWVEELKRLLPLD